MFYVIKHVLEEGPGLFEKPLPVDYITLLAGKDAFPSIHPDDIVLIMGGPMGVYEKQKYPFIEKELDFIRKCYDMNIRALGVCLGAQMIAEALGGRVYKGHIKETGWYDIRHTWEAAADPVFSVFPKSMPVFQWHQDTFDLPPPAIRLVYSNNYPNQAFRIGARIYGLQYHIEATAEILKDWFPGQEDSVLINRTNLTVLRPLALEFFRRFLNS